MTTEKVAIVDRDTARSRGLIHYRTGRPCHRGHDAPRYVSSGGCVECQMRFVGAGPVTTHTIVDTDGLRTVELVNRSTRGVYQWRRTAEGAFEFRQWGLGARHSGQGVRWQPCPQLATGDTDREVLAMLMGAPAPNAEQPAAFLVIHVTGPHLSTFTEYVKQCIATFEAAGGCQGAMRVL